MCNVLSFAVGLTRQRGCTQVLSPLPFCSLCAKSTTLYAQKRDVWWVISLLWFESKLLTYASMLRIYHLARLEIPSPK